jgi:short-subunit dehydrogenase
MNLATSSVLLTGAAGGIGSAVARTLGARGARLLLTDLRTVALDELAERLAGDGSASTVLAADVTAAEGRAALVAAARRAQTDVLVNLAGVNPFGLFVEQPPELIEQALRINAAAPLLLTHAMIPVLEERARGVIVNVGSAFGSLGYPGFAIYSASKFALRGFSEALRRELADTRIRVRYVAPRATRTALATNRIRAMNEVLGVGMDTPETVARAIAAAIETGRNETFLGTAERWFARLNALVPSLVDGYVRKQLDVIRRFASTAAASTAPAASPTLPVSPAPPHTNRYATPSIATEIQRSPT